MGARNPMHEETRVALVNTLRDEIKRLREINTDLLAALEEIANADEQVFAGVLRRIARAALAKATGA